MQFVDLSAQICKLCRDWW